MVLEYFPLPLLSKNEHVMAKEFGIADTYFKFPVRIYNEVDVQRVLMQEQKNMEENERRIELGQEELPVEDVPWILGQARVPYRIAKDLYWMDSYSKSRSIVDVDEKGFDFTAVYSPDGEAFNCAWKREKWEKNYFEYLEQMEEYLEKKNSNKSNTSTSLPPITLLGNNVDNKNEKKE